MANLAQVTFEKAFEHTVGLEGGYVDDPRDSGGATRFGITEATARAAGYPGAMRDLPLTTAKRIYRERYWDALNLGAIAELAPRIACELFDTAVNMGTGVPGRWLQRGLNALNRGGADYGELVVDGKLGGKSVWALKAYLAKRGKGGEAVLLALLNGLQAAFYLELAERRAKDEAFLYGWLANRVAA